jgi:glycolate oxidase FAD binding subunit
MAELTPRDEADLSEAVRAAAAAGQAITVRGGGTRETGAPAPGDILCTTGLSGIVLHDPGALTLVARAGTPLSEIEAALAAENQHLAFEPWSLPGRGGSNRASTIGGVAATNAAGPRRIQAGACRDAMLGVRFVDGTGTVVKNGGRVMKNVTGLDLVKLMAGSRGTLGVLTEISFKVLPRPLRVASVAIDGLDVAGASLAMTTATASPYDVTGAAHLPEGPEGGPLTLLRLEGLEGAVGHRAGALSRLLGGIGTPRVIEGPEPWARVRDAGGLAPEGSADGAADGSALWRISVRPTDAPALAQALVGARLAFDWAGGLVWGLAAPDLDVRGRMAGIPGHATLVKGPAEAFARWGQFHPEPAAVAALAAGLRAKFDPAGILNPGLMGPRAAA